MNEQYLVDLAGQNKLFILEAPFGEVPIKSTAYWEVEILIKDQLFVELVHKHFDFLVNEFGYIVDKEYQSHDQYDSGYVEFQSLTTSVRIDKDGQNILVSISPMGEPEISRQYLPTVLEALSFTNGENFPVIVVPSEYENALHRYASALKEKCKNLLVGDFSHWLDVLKFNIKKRKKDYFSWSGKELPPETFRKLENYIKSKSS